MGIWAGPGMPLTLDSREERYRSPSTTRRGHDAVRDMPDPT